MCAVLSGVHDCSRAEPSSAASTNASSGRRRRPRRKRKGSLNRSLLMYALLQKTLKQCLVWIARFLFFQQSQSTKKASGGLDDEQIDPNVRLRILYPLFIALSNCQVVISTTAILQAAKPSSAAAEGDWTTPLPTQI